MKTSAEIPADKDLLEPSPPARRGRYRARLALALGSLTVALLAAEIAARVLHLGGAVYAPRRFEPGGGVPFVPLDPQRNLLVYRPHATFASVYDPAGDRRKYFGPDGRVEYRINAFGLRGPEIPPEKTPGSFCVLCLGDSFTFGEGVREEDTYAARLQKLLMATGGYPQVEVINAGVQAYGTPEEVAFYAIQGYQFKPDVVVLAFVLNDATDFAETIRQNDARIKDTPLSWPARVSKLWETVERRRRATRLQDEFFETTRRSFRGPGWQECKRLLTELSQRGRTEHFRLVVMLFPYLYGLDGTYPLEDLHALVRSACQDAGCDFIDLLDVYRGRPSESLWVHPTDQHPNEIAHRLAAERLAEYVATPAHPKEGDRK